MKFLIPSIFIHLAEAYGLPLLPPYLALKKGIKAENGVNFATAGATAIAAEYFYSKNITILWTNISLTHQLGWFQQVKSNICATRKGMVIVIVFNLPWTINFFDSSCFM